jgi:hypothetical protein
MATHMKLPGASAVEADGTVGALVQVPDGPVWAPGRGPDAVPTWSPPGAGMAGVAAGVDGGPAAG